MELTYRVLTGPDADALKALVAKVCATMDDDMFFIPYSPDEYKMYLSGTENAVMVGVFADGALVAFGAMKDNGDGEYELDGAGVMSGYRNNGTQNRLICHRANMAREMGGRYVVAYCHPANKASLNNMIKNGFVEIGEKALPNGTLRKKMKLDLV